MKRAMFLLVVLLMSMGVAAARTGTGDGGPNPFETAFPAGGEIRMDLCSSGVVVRGTDENQIRVRYSGRDDGHDVKVKFKSDGNRGQLNISGCPRNNFQITIEIPKVTDLRVRMFAGQLEVEKVTGNKDLEIDAGQMIVDVGKAEEYAHVDGSVTTGQVDASPFNVSKGGLFRSFHQTGPGKYRLHAHVGAGQVELN
jgi:hypothetical protein